MAKIENPNSGRAKIYENPDQFQVRVKSKSNFFVTAFLMFWLCGWAFGELMVLGTLLSGKAGAGSLFLLAWLGGWTIGGLFALSQVLWNIAGYELLTISDSVLTIQRHIPFFRRSWSYDTGHIANIQANENPPNGTLFGGQQNMHGLFSNRSFGGLKFDYGLRTTGFGMGLEPAEARMVADKVSNRLGIHQ